MSLTEAVNLLAEREALKTSVIGEIKKYLEWKEQGHAGAISFNVFKVDGFPEDAKFTLDYTISEDAKLKSESTSDLLLQEKVEVFISQKVGFADINCKVSLGKVDIEVEINSETNEASEVTGVIPDAPSSIYCGRFYFETVPDETEMRDEIEGKTDGEQLTGKPVVFHVRASYDDFEAAVRSRETELAQIEEEIEKARELIKDAQKKDKEASSSSTTTATKKSKASKEDKDGDKKKKKKKVSLGGSEKAAAAAASTSAEDNESAKEPATPWSETIVNAGGMAVGLGLQYRAYLLFGAAAVGIFLFGDATSV